MFPHNIIKYRYIYKFYLQQLHKSSELCLNILFIHSILSPFNGLLVSINPLFCIFNELLVATYQRLDISLFELIWIFCLSFMIQFVNTSLHRRPFFISSTYFVFTNEDLRWYDSYIFLYTPKQIFCSFTIFIWMLTLFKHITGDVL